MLTSIMKDGTTVIMVTHRRARETRSPRRAHA
jgi:hypothetical protein